MAIKTFENCAELKLWVGKEVAVTDWLTVTQERINDFAKASDDYQWIHVDPERAAKSPFGCIVTPTKIFTRVRDSLPKRCNKRA